MEKPEKLRAEIEKHPPEEEKTETVKTVNLWD